MYSPHIHTRQVALLTLVALCMQIVSPIFPTSYALNNTFYVDFTGGNDGNDGLSPATAWQTISKINGTAFSEGDNILLNCGNTWTEQLVLKDSGVEGNPITYSIFGTCDGTNNPIISGISGVTITESGSVSYVTLSNINSSGSIELLGTAAAATGIILQNMSLSNPLSTCIDADSDKYLVISGSTFSNCETSIALGTLGGANIVNNSFSTGGSMAMATVHSSGSVIQAFGNTFYDIIGGAISFSDNSVISENSFTNICTLGSPCSVLSDNGSVLTTASISDNAIINVGTGIIVGGYQDAIRISYPSQSLSISENTISNAQVGIHLIGAANITASTNTVFNTRAEAILVEELDAGTTVNNTISGNTFLTYNPAYAMVKMYDAVDAIGTLASLSNNRYINVYKGKYPIIESFTTGGDSYALDKENLTALDAGATNFTYFGYRSYTSTGTYSGSNLITNGAFGANIAGWSSTNVTLSHDATGSTLHAAQDASLTGIISSNTFSTVSGAVYEVSGTFRNLTNPNGSHLIAYVRKNAAPDTLYVDRALDIVSTATTKTFRTYVTANTTAADARLDILVSNPSTDIELDSIVVRRVTGLTANPRTNEARLLVNTTSTSSNMACPGGGGCPIQYRDLTDNAVTFPVSVGAHSSEIILWRDPNSSFTPVNILYAPIGSLVPSLGSVPNNQEIDLTWTSEDASTVWLTGSTLTGAFSYMVASTGTIRVTPPSDGTTTFVLNLENDIGHTILNADVVTSNTPPVTDAANFPGFEDSLSITGVVTATDINSGGTISYSLFDPPLGSQGSITSFDSDGTVDFMPAADFCGPATFSFRAFDAYGLGSDGLNPGIVTINVMCTNDPPVAIDDSFTATGGISNLIDVLTNETDIDSPFEAQTYFLTGFTNPDHGTLTITGNVFDYVPDAMYVGSDSFLYTMVDQSGAISNTGTVTLTVIPGSNLPPFVAPDSYLGLTEDTPFVATLSGYDLNPGDILSFTATVNPANGIVTMSGNEFTYTPNANFNGADSFVFVASDGALTSSAATIDLSVSGTPDLPVVVDDVISVEMSANVTLDVMANDNDPDSPYAPQNLTISGYTLPTNGTLSVSGTGFIYTSNTPYLGPDTFSYSIADGDGNISGIATVSLDITSNNTPPLSYTGAFTTNEDTTHVGMLSGYDADGTPLTFILVSNVSNGVLSVGSTGGFIYTPTTNYNGSDSFTYRVSDGVFTSAAELMSITVDAANDAPNAGHDTATGTEDTTLILTGLLLNDTDIDLGDVVSLAGVLTQGAKGTAVLSGSTEIVYVPVPDTCGMDTVTYQAQDQSGALSGTGNITISMICTNDAPTASGSSYTMTGNIATNSGLFLTGGLAGSDIDLDVLTYTLGDTTINGVLSFNTGGSFTYTPVLNFTGSDSFTFSATDGILTTGTATVIITVTPNTYNTAPIAYSGSFITNEDTTLVGTLSGFDIEMSTLTYSIGSGVTQGTLSLGSTGGFVYTPTSNYYGSDSFTFRISDGLTFSSYVTGTITVISVNDLPIASNDSATITEDLIGTFLVLANDTDVDGTVTSLTGFTQPSTGGTLAISGTGLLFTPTSNFCSVTPLLFSYSAVDNSGGTSSAATGSITVTCIGDAPVVLGDTATGTEDTSFVIPVLANDSDPDTGDTLTLTGLTQPSTGGSVSVSGTGFLFTPTPNYCNVAPITFTYRALDSTSILSNTGTVSVSVTCVNDLPIASNDSIVLTEDTVSTIPVLANDTDVDGTIVALTGLTQPSIGGTLSISGTGILFTPISNYCTSTSTTFNYRSVDNVGGLSAVATGSFTVFCVNDLPVAVDDAQSSTEDATFTILAFSNDTDVDAGDTVSLYNFSQPLTGGTITTTAGGFFFTPIPNFCSGTGITFGYRVRDTLFNVSNTGTVTLNINCVNDLPVVENINLTMTGISSSGGTSTILSTLSGTDIEGGPLTFSATMVNTGFLVFASTGAFTYSPTVGFVGPATFNYMANDGAANSNTGVVTICVISPDTTVARPSCASPAEPAPSTGVISGNGGGGGSSGGGSSSSTFNYTSVTYANANAVTTGLLSQLMLGRLRNFTPLFHTPTTTTNNINVPFTTLLDTIVSVVEYSRDFDISSGDNVSDIRYTGRSIVTNITSSDTLTREQKADALREAAKVLRAELSPRPYAREYKALQYVIRILTSKEALLRDAVDTATTIFTSTIVTQPPTRAAERRTNTGSVTLIGSNGANGGVYGLSYITETQAGDYYTIPYTYSKTSILKTTSRGLTTTYYSGVIFAQASIMDNAGNLHFGNTGDSRLYTLGQDMQFMSQELSVGNNVFPFAINARGDLFFTTNNSSIYRMTLSGSLTTHATLSLSGAPSIYDASLDTDGTVYLATQTGITSYIVKVDGLTGTQSVIATGSAALGNIHIAAHHGDVYVSKFTNAIYRINSLGNLELFATLPDTIVDMDTSRIGSYIYALTSKGEIYRISF